MRLLLMLVLPPSSVNPTRFYKPGWGDWLAQPGAWVDTALWILFALVWGVVLLLLDQCIQRGWRGKP
jgi:hypothetical protein